ncbi:MAG TPA: ATP-binding cassette domain-containing protein [Methanospirillum sp.]|uniref:ATP-binding cassette domain-containing protein n=1 Tax=Methanospirillum sp. TaxID=45200 RepID=UPI002C457A65|nr:ATP-binding cassette domain-containing protein [Methanospirillum sp.]HOJ96786.1 ATP-binding cassette domain-containing protein [Methanospirillum sp.]HOL41364.1 ATP-binding cassette domain-containing protein [Methanospirillum sp.]HPP78945.1 ATP-binding cassette domain-containing protein [Methanospirillum sp.]
MNIPPLIRLSGVVKTKGAFTLHAEGTFGPGVHLLTGRIGSGKTTLGEILAGIIQPDTGTISWTGGRRVMLLQDASYHISTMTVREEAASWHADPDVIIRRAGLTGKEDADLFTLSRGEVRRLELAAILSGEYELIVLDEPFAGLDEDARCFVRRLIETRRDAVVVIISHDITSLPKIDQLVAMEAGTLIQIGQVPQCLQNWNEAPALIRYLRKNGVCPAGLSREDLEEALCRIRG